MKLFFDGLFFSFVICISHIVFFKDGCELNIRLPQDSFKQQYLFISIPLNSHGGVIFKFYLTRNPMEVMKVFFYLAIGNTIITPARNLKLTIMPKIRCKNTIVLVIVAYQWLLFAIYFPNVWCHHFP